MPLRLEPFLNGSIYHVFNRTIDGKKIFENDKYPSLFIDIISYYRSFNLELSYSKLKRLDNEQQNIIFQGLKQGKDYRVNILAYCLMPTHFHLLLRQDKDDGISRFISDSLNSFTRRYNLENKRKGPIFLPKFKSTSINTDELLLHVSRYIHLNPYSSGLVRNIEEIKFYSWSSYREYLGKENAICDTSLILSMFGDNQQAYSRFVLDNADYQKNLESVKYTDKW